MQNTEEIFEPFEDQQQRETHQKFVAAKYVRKPYAAFGDGSDGWVYCYYFPYVRELVEATNGSKWPCKIGCTTQRGTDGKLLGAETRIARQIHGTSTFEPPEIGFHAKSKDASKLEDDIHEQLDHKKYKNDYGSGLGKEWFLVSLYEVRKAYREVLYPKWHHFFHRIILMLKMEAQSRKDDQKRLRQRKKAAQLKQKSLRESH